MKKIDVEKVCAIIREVAEAHIMPRFRNLQTGDIAFKKGDDPVTIADKEAEKELSTRLLDLLPGSKVVGEEVFHTNKGVLKHFLSESPVWIIDPVDGTRNFVRGSTNFGVIVALAERNQAVAGWIYNPTSDEFFMTEKGAGAFYKGRKLKVLPPAELTAMNGFFGQRLMHAYQKARMANSGPTVAAGSTTSVFDYPRLISPPPRFHDSLPQSHFRASLRFGTPWDDAAGVLMHQEAGGYSAHWDGGSYDPSAFHRGMLLAPDKESWQSIMNWCRKFSRLAPAETAA